MELSNVEKLEAKLKTMNMRLGGVSVTPGTVRDHEAIAAELLKVIEAIEAGEYQECLLYDSDYFREQTGMTEEEIENHPEEFTRRYREAFHDSKSPYSPHGVFWTLVRLMGSDNGCVFKPTEDQRERALPFIRQLIAEGYFQEENVNDIASSFWQAASPEFTETPIYFKHSEAYKGLDKILNEIFDEPL